MLVALPSVRLVRGVLSGKRLVLVGRKDYGLLLERAGVVDEAASADEARWAPLIAAFSDPDARRLDLAPGLAGLGSDDLVLGWFGGTGRERRPGPLHRFFFEETEAFFRSRGFSTPPFEACAGLPAIGPGTGGRPALFGGGDPAGRFAVIHPGSGSPRKCWPVDRFLAVAAALSGRGIGGLVVTGLAEGRLEPALRTAPLPAGWTWRPNPPLPDLAAWLAEAGVYLGNDSGVTHLAAACGTRTVALFRDEFKDAWRPAGDVRLLSAPEVADIPVSSVLEAVST